MKKLVFILAALCAVLCAALVIRSSLLNDTEPSQEVSASHNESGGTTSQKPAEDYPVVDNVSDDNNISAGDSVPAVDNTVNHVKNGEVFTVEQGVTLKIDDTFEVDEGGSVNIRGAVEIAEQGVLNCSGSLYIDEGGSISVDGTLQINSTGSACGEGSIIVNHNFSDIVCHGDVYAHIQPPAPVEIDGVTYIGGVLIANKQFSLPRTYGDGLTDDTYSAYVEMKDASGYDMSIVSGFRSYEKQESTFNYWCSIDGYDRAITYSALPGQSEHQTGLAMDISSLEQSYGKTAEGMWLAEHCHEYGFIIRYPQGKDDITGYIYEPWHVRYLGKSTAKLVHDSGLTLEEFLGVA